jgi:hypothetical protein
VNDYLNKLLRYIKLVEVLLGRELLQLNLINAVKLLDVIKRPVLIVNHQGEIVAAKVTTGNVHDTQPVRELAIGLTDKLYGEKGYLSKALEADLFDKGITLITTVRKNMKAKAMSLWDRAMLSKRFIIETISDQLKNISFIEHSRYRSMNRFMLNLLAGLVAYCLSRSQVNYTEI